MKPFERKRSRLLSKVDVIKQRGRTRMSINVEEYYRLYGGMVLRRCRLMLKNEEKALDAMQDVFVRLLMKQDQLKGDYPSALLNRIAINICLNIIRYDKRRPETGDDAILYNIATYDRNEERLLANGILDRVFHGEKESTREIAVMHYMDRMTLEDVAAAVGLSVSGVRKRLRNLRTKVQAFEEM